MRGVITGGAGFLGSHVADVLAQHGHQIVVVDIGEAKGHKSIRANLENVDQLISAFEGVDFVCHLAAVGDVYLAAENPALAARSNVVGSANVAEACLAAGVKRLVYASTWEVYGKPTYEPLDESHRCAPDHPYSITKLAGESLCLSYTHLRQDLDVCALRLGTAYGLRMRPNSVFSIFIQRALRGEPITIQGRGTQGRQFTHARDIGRAFALALEHARQGGVYNVVSDEVITISQLAEFVVKSVPTTVTYSAARAGDVPSARVSSAKATAELLWRPEVAFTDGLEEIIADAKAEFSRSGRSLKASARQHTE